MNQSNQHQHPQQEESQSLPKDNHTYKFKCLDCKKEFEIQSESSNVTEVFPMMCPFCGAKKNNGRLEHQMLSPATIKENDLKKRRKENASHNKQTMEMVGSARVTEPKVEMVEVAGKAGRFSSGTESVPKQAVDNMTNKLLNK